MEYFSHLVTEKSVDCANMDSCDADFGCALLDNTSKCTTGLPCHPHCGTVHCMNCADQFVI